MADNLTALANTGAGTDVLATDEIAGVHYPRSKVGFGDDGSYTDVSASAPLPVAVAGAATEVTIAAVADLLQELAVRLCDIADSVSNLMPDVAGRLRVSAESAVIASGTLTAVTTVGTVTTVTTMANQTNIGGFAANQHIMALTQMCEADLRRNIVIS